ncbi:MAG: anaerobic ribonucleoside-triphosphate reductase activating protein [Bacteroidetes bacterium GWE2_29_8]|nr:MAG: anaerobic ribonucleoside-triphosphate reductase activating protein [Bacteroidetes bacterium GWE2_29_8]
MRIGALLKQSFIDWDGYIVAVIFTKGCNFCCNYCHNPSLVLSQLLNESKDVSEEEVFDYLMKRKSWLDGVVVSGGEPTIHKDLKNLFIKIKSLGLKTKLDTNGTNPKILQELIQNKLIDFVALDIKTLLNKKDYASVANTISDNTIKNIKSSLNILSRSEIKYQLRTTLIPSHHNMNIINNLKISFTNEENYIFQNYRNTDNVQNYI